MLCKKKIINDKSKYKKEYILMLNDDKYKYDTIFILPIILQLIRGGFSCKSRNFYLTEIQNSYRE